jgi:hypothetical protein
VLPSALFSNLTSNLLASSYKLWLRRNLSCWTPCCTTKLLGSHVLQDCPRHCTLKHFIKPLHTQTLFLMIRGPQLRVFTCNTWFIRGPLDLGSLITLLALTLDCFSSSILSSWSSCHQALGMSSSSMHCSLTLTLDPPIHMLATHVRLSFSSILEYTFSCPCFLA